MFDRNKLERFLDSLQVETHFPSVVPQKIVEPPRSPLAEKMDKYDVFVQGNFNHNHGTREFPVYGPRPDDSQSFWLAGGPYATYGLMNWPGSLGGFVTGAVAGSGDEAQKPHPPKETPYDRLKTKLTRLVAAPSFEVANPSPPVRERSPDFVHVLTAWRGWEVADGELEALGCAARWEPRRAPKANCRASRQHAAPAMDCNCGYWSFKSLDLLTQAMETYANSVDVIGQVEIWGRVIECENGWRSEYAYPRELWLLEEGLENLSWKYGVPVRRLA